MLFFGSAFHILNLPFHYILKGEHGERGDAGIKGSKGETGEPGSPGKEARSDFWSLTVILYINWLQPLLTVVLLLLSRGYRDQKETKDLQWVSILEANWGFLQNCYTQILALEVWNFDAEFQLLFKW